VLLRHAKGSLSGSVAHGSDRSIRLCTYHRCPSVLGCLQSVKALGSGASPARHGANAHALRRNTHIDRRHACCQEPGLASSPAKIAIRTRVVTFPYARRHASRRPGPAARGAAPRHDAERTRCERTTSALACTAPRAWSATHRVGCRRRSHALSLRDASPSAPLGLCRCCVGVCGEPADAAQGRSGICGRRSVRMAPARSAQREAAFARRARSSQSCFSRFRRSGTIASRGWLGTNS